MNRVYIYPANVKGNPYIERTIEVLSNGGFCVRPLEISLSGLLTLGRQNALILNWYEDRLASPKPVPLQLLLSILILLYCRVLFRKVVWVKHNIESHDRKGGRARALLVRLLSICADVCVTHRPITGCAYVPHPLYEGSCQREKTTGYLYYGLIKEYKGLVPLLNEWPKALPLKIIGYCADADLEAEIWSVINERCLEVEWENEFAEREYLDEEIQKAESVIIPHLNDSMLVSGAAFEALAHGANVFMRAGPSGNYFSDFFEGAHTFELDTLSRVLLETPRIDSLLVKGSVVRECSDEIVAGAWRRLLEYGL